MPRCRCVTPLYPVFEEEKYKKAFKVLSQFGVSLEKGEAMSRPMVSHIKDAIAKSVVFSMLAGAGLIYLDERSEKVLDMTLNGFSQKEIGQVINRSDSLVGNIQKDLAKVIDRGADKLAKLNRLQEMSVFERVTLAYKALLGKTIFD